MGCFSYKCKKCNQPVLSDSWNGYGSDEVVLFLLNKGKVEQTMAGRYNSYGAVFEKEEGLEALKWNREWSLAEEGGEQTVCDLMFDEDESNGMAAYHKRCHHGQVPTTRSEDDPNQGWEMEDDDDYM